MSNQRTHDVTTTDGVTIGGTVHGQGPPLVFVHGMMADGDIAVGLTRRSAPAWHVSGSRHLGERVMGRTISDARTLSVAERPSRRSRARRPC